MTILLKKTLKERLLTEVKKIKKEKVRKTVSTENQVKPNIIKLAKVHEQWVKQST